MILKLESKKLYIGDWFCYIVLVDFNLLELFIKMFKYFLIKEDIKNVFWLKDNNFENKIYSYIFIFKFLFKDFFEY